jgi:hypothetical protein
MVTAGMGVGFAVSVIGSALVALATVQAFLRSGQELIGLGKPPIAGKVTGNNACDDNYNGH